MAKQTAKTTKPSTRRIRPMHIVDVLIVLVLIGGVIFAVTKARSTPECAEPGITHRLQLRDDKFSTTDLRVKQCDVIAIENHDDLPYSLNFGQHDKHISYPGYTPQTFQKNESIRIDALTRGTFQLHDHFRDNAQLTLTVE